MEPEKQIILSHFALDEEAVCCAPHGCGHVNRTFLVTDGSGKQYILQRVNHIAFPHVNELMNNIRLVTEHLRTKTDDPRAVMSVVPTKDGASYCIANGEYWRVLNYTEGTICLQRPESNADLFECGAGFGRFGQQLADFPAEQLFDTIENFHNTPDRYRIFREAIREDPLGRAAGVSREIDFLMESEERVSRLQSYRDSGELPLRVTHNDTKLNNVLLDEKTRKALCIIDLDTVMGGLSAYDFGDAIRFGAATTEEDDRNYEHMELDLGLFRAFAKGYLGACPALTAEERDNLPLGALTMTTECGMRFLTDYLKGDIYFSIAYPEHNLVRSRTQLHMAADMAKKWDEMHRIIKEEA